MNLSLEASNNLYNYEAYSLQHLMVYRDWFTIDICMKYTEINAIWWFGVKWHTFSNCIVYALEWVSTDSAKL